MFLFDWFSTGKREKHLWDGREIVIVDKITDPKLSEPIKTAIMLTCQTANIAKKFTKLEFLIKARKKKPILRIFLLPLMWI